MKCKVSSFTLLEILLSVSIISILAGLTMPLYQSFQNRNDLDIAASTFAQASRRASILSRAVDEDTNWGIYVENGTLTIYKGSSFALRDNTYDEIYPLSTSMTISGTREYNFAKLSGYPLIPGTITFTSVNNESRNVSINTKGTIIY